MNQLVSYLIAHTSELPPPTSSSMFDYILTRNGLFIRAKRQGFQVTAQLSRCHICGLTPLTSQFQFDYPKVPASLLQEMLTLSRNATPQEILFHLYWNQQQWCLDVPLQSASPTQVQRQESGFDSTYRHALIEVHSHHSMGAYFSPEDDRDESGLRIFGVLGTIFSQPTFRLRVGIYHQLFWEIPYRWVFESDYSIMDGVN